MTRPFTLYALGSIAMAIAVGCFIKWPALFLVVGAVVAALALVAGLAAVFVLGIVWLFMGPGAAR